MIQILVHGTIEWGFTQLSEDDPLFGKLCQRFLVETMELYALHYSKRKFPSILVYFSSPNTYYVHNYFKHDLADDDDTASTITIIFNSATITDKQHHYTVIQRQRHHYTSTFTSSSDREEQSTPYC